MSKEAPHRMHWWFFVDKLVPWMFAGALLAILLLMSGMVSDRFALPANLYSRIQISTVALIGIGAASSVLISAIQWSCTRLTIDGDQLVYAKGVLNRTVAKVPIQEIASIDLGSRLVNFRARRGRLRRELWPRERRWGTCRIWSQPAANP